MSPEGEATQEKSKAAAYLDGNGDHLVGQVFVQQADGCGQELQSAGVRFVGVDAVQQLEVHDEDVPLLEEARANVSESEPARRALGGRGSPGGP